MATINVSIIIVGYCSEQTLPACLISISEQKNINAEVIYVENAPHHSAEKTVKTFCPSARIIAPGENLGFPKGCNLGANSAQGEYLLFLNPDTEIQTSETLALLEQFMSSHPDVGICTPLIYDSDQKEAAIIRRDYFGQQYINNQFSQLPGNIAWVCGAALMISKKTFEKIQGFDARYFMYSEDEDICLTTRKAGLSIAQVPQTRVMHIGGQSAKCWNTAEQHFRVELSRTLFTKKHYTPTQHHYIWKRRRQRLRRSVPTSFLFAPRKLSHYLGKLRAIRKGAWQTSQAN